MEQESISLDEALGDAPAVEAQPEIVAETPEAEIVPVVEAAPEGLTPEPEETWTKAAVMDERGKRQTFERELADAKQVIAQYQGYVQGMSPQQNTEAQSEPDFWTDPEAAMSRMQENLTSNFQGQLNQVQRTSQDHLLNMSENMVAQAHEDFPQVKAHVEAMLKANPAIIQQQMNGNRNHPWLAVYQFAKKDMELGKIGDLDAFKQATREEMKAEALAEVRAELEASGQKLANVPTSLVNQPSKGSVNAADWTGPTSLDSLLG